MINDERKTKLLIAIGEHIYFKEFTKAKNKLDKALETYKNDPAFYLPQVQILVGLNKHKDALDIINRLIKPKYNSWDTIVVFYRAACMYKLNPSNLVWLEELKKVRATSKEISALAINSEEFATVKNNANFLAALGLGKAKKLDVVVASFVKLVESGEEGPYSYKKALKYIDKHTDQASVLDFAIVAVNNILDDLEEHGDTKSKAKKTEWKIVLNGLKEKRKMCKPKKSDFKLELDRLGLS